MFTPSDFLSFGFQFLQVVYDKFFDTIAVELKVFRLNLNTTSFGVFRSLLCQRSSVVGRLVTFVVADYDRR